MPIFHFLGLELGCVHLYLFSFSRFGIRLFFICAYCFLGLELGCLFVPIFYFLGLELGCVHLCLLSVFSVWNEVVCLRIFSVFSVWN